MRALVGGDATEPVDAALRDTEAYSGLLRDALKLGMGTRGLTTFKLGASDKTAKRS